MTAPADPFRVVILHEWDGRPYFQALDGLVRAETGKPPLYREMWIFRQLAVGLVRRDFRLVGRALGNALFFLRSFFLRDRVVLMGVAPCDPALLFWRRLMRRNRVVYHTSWTEWSGGRFAKNSPVARARVEAAWRSFLEDPRLRAVSILSESKRAMLANYRIDEARIAVIPHAVDRAVFRAQKPASPSPRLRVAYVGRLAVVKGIDVLSEIILGADPERFEFTLVGDGPERGTLQKALGGKNVAWHGHVADKRRIADLMAGHDVMVLPSISEQFGIALIEGMACGLVPLASDGLVPKDLVHPGGNGFIEKREAGAFLAVLRRLDGDRELLERLRVKALAKASEYDLEAVAARWRALLQGLAPMQSR